MQIRRSGDRAVTETAGIRTAHSLSFGAHYDPENVAYGPLVAFNDDLIQPGAGYGRHPHRETEIVTWVLSGRLTYADSAGHRGVAAPGFVQVLRAGAGVEHSEMNEGDEPVRFLQSWLTPAQRGAAPQYRLLDVREAMQAGRWCVVGSGDLGESSAPDNPGASEGSGESASRDYIAGGPAVAIGCPGAALLVATCPSATALAVPPSALAHVFVAGGCVRVDGHVLSDGDVVRLDAADERTVLVEEPATLVAWLFDVR